MTLVRRQLGGLGAALIRTNLDTRNWALTSGGSSGGFLSRFTVKSHAHSLYRMAGRLLPKRGGRARAAAAHPGRSHRVSRPPVPRWTGGREAVSWPS
jgi:hypothetical protein